MHTDAAQHDEDENDEQFAIFFQSVDIEQLGELGEEGTLRRFAFGREFYILKQATSDNTDYDDNAAQQIEEGEIAEAVDQHACCDHRDDLREEDAQVEYTFHSSAGFGGGDVRCPCTECGVVGGGTEEGHDRVSDNDHDDGNASGLDVRNGWKQNGGEPP